MKKLRVLRVVFHNEHETPSLERQMKILEPLKAVKGLDVFEVGWTWEVREGEGVLELGEVPFQVVDKRHHARMW